jgi:ferritin-like metal-binding protein YciE
VGAWAFGDQDSNYHSFGFHLIALHQSSLEPAVNTVGLKRLETEIEGENMSALREAFVDELRDLLDAERQLLKALPTMAKSAENEQLRAAFLEHQDQTTQQIRRLGQVFEAFEETPRGKKCKGMEGLLQEADEKIKEKEGDAALIAAAQKAEHYEIAAYGTLISWAVALGHDDVVEVLTEILEEEKQTDKKLTVIALSVVNSHESQREPEPKTPSRRPKRTRTTRPTKTQTTRSRTTRRAKTKTQNNRSPRSKRLRSASNK